MNELENFRLFTRWNTEQAPTTTAAIHEFGNQNFNWLHSTWGILRIGHHCSSNSASGLPISLWFQHVHKQRKKSGIPNPWAQTDNWCDWVRPNTVAAAKRFKGKCISRLQTDTKAHWAKQIIVKPGYSFWARFNDSGRVHSCLFYIISLMVIIYILRLDTCVQLIYIPPQQGKLGNPIEGCLEIGLNHLISPWKRYIMVRKADRRCHGAHYTVSSWNHHLVSFGDLPLRQFLT